MKLIDMIRKLYMSKQIVWVNDPLRRRGVGLSYTSALKFVNLVKERYEDREPLTYGEFCDIFEWPHSLVDIDTRIKSTVFYKKTFLYTRNECVMRKSDRTAYVIDLIVCND